MVIIIVIAELYYSSYSSHDIQISNQHLQCIRCIDFGNSSLTAGDVSTCTVQHLGLAMHRAASEVIRTDTKLLAG